MGRKRSFSTIRWRRHGARLGSFLGNARAIRDLADDARSKYEGDFIFDRQYVLSVIDQTIEHLDALLFDARVMGADTAALEPALVQCKSAGRDLFTAEPAPPVASSDPPQDPEYLLLARCSAWLDGRESDSPSAMELVRRSTDAIMDAIGEDRELEVAAEMPELELPHAAGRVRVADLGGGVEAIERGSLSARDLHCRPLGVLLMGAADGASGSHGRGRDRWLAVVDRRHLSLRREPRGRFVLEATLTGERQSDWLFVYSTDGDPPDLPGLRSERTERGWVLWDSGSEGVDQVLVGLGEKLLAPT